MSSPPASSGALASQKTSSEDDNGAGKMEEEEEEVDHLLAKLKDAGLEIDDDQIIRIIDEEIARIKAEAARGATNEAGRNEKIEWWRLMIRRPAIVCGIALITIASSYYIGYYTGYDTGIEDYYQYLRETLADNLRNYLTDHPQAVIPLLFVALAGRRKESAESK
ncbi:hypothetical protein ACP70R_014487 [Stipagrostis hirtigluma subsp. patula]